MTYPEIRCWVCSRRFASYATSQVILKWNGLYWSGYCCCGREHIRLNSQVAERYRKPVTAAIKAFENKMYQMKKEAQS